MENVLKDIESVAVVKPVTIYQKHHNKYYYQVDGVTLISDKEKTWVIDNSSGGRIDNIDYYQVMFNQDTHIDFICGSHELRFNVVEYQDNQFMEL